MESLTAISPVDGRYRGHVEELSRYFSEGALIRYRVMVEIEYFIALSEIPLPPLATLPAGALPSLREIYLHFTPEDAARVKEIERVTNHDVKAVEYFIKERLETLGLGACKEFVHFGLTSQDINNTALPCAFKDAVNEVYYPLANGLVARLDALATAWADIPMLARTHGQPASPTRLGKEIKVFAYRARRQLELLAKVACSGKFGGATGNFNAHHAAYPDVDWKAFADRFLTEKLHIEREQYTTQVSNYDNLAAICDNLRRVNTIILDLDRDLWTYVALGYFQQRLEAGEVGSSAMPHKVNPIDFENSEGNLGIANAILEHLADKLPVSRLQRDLTDSTVIRNIGVPVAHTVIAFKSTLKGLDKLIVNRAAIDLDLEDNWAVVAEAIQTILRREGFPNPYEALKALTRVNAKVTRATIADFIDSLDVPGDLKAALKEITPDNYTGI
jgi:adenylosuccinate lyase